MREEVAIILNEREQTKIRAAETLVEKLSAQSLRAARLPINENIVRSIRTRKPRVVVLDYLLGDLTTGLDILAEISKLPAAQRPSCYFLTDEPSQSVAIEAMRLGCRDFVHIESPQAIERLCEEVTQEVGQAKHSRNSSSAAEPFISLDSLVASSKNSIELINHASRAAKIRPPAIIISGPRGSGKTTLAQAIYREAGAPGFLREIDAQTLSIPISAALAIAPDRAGAFNHEMSLLFKHAEEDDGEFLLEYAKRAKAQCLKRSANTTLTLITVTDPKFASTWRRIHSECEYLRIPPLAERKEDIPALVHRFHNEACTLLNQKLKPLAPALISWFSDRTWPGDIQELRAVALHLALSKEAETDEDPEALAAKWEQDFSAEANSVLYSRQTVATVLHRVGGDVRRAAARLGIPSQQLREMLAREDDR